MSEDSDTGAARVVFPLWRCGIRGGGEVMSTVMGVRLEFVGNDGAAQSRFLCRGCWATHTPDLDVYCAYDLDAGEAGGACCAVCAWPLVERLDVCVSCGDALPPSRRGLCPGCRTWAQTEGRLAEIIERAWISAVALARDVLGTSGP